jgi:hypothetical protein
MKEWRGFASGSDPEGLVNAGFGKTFKYWTIMESIGLYFDIRIRMEDEKLVISASSENLSYDF